MSSEIRRPLQPGAAALVWIALAACGGSTASAPDLQPAAASPRPPALERVAALDRMPSGVALVGDRVFVSVPRWVERGDATVYEWRGGALAPYPDPEANDTARGPAALHSVNGLHADSRGWLWMLDNGRIDLGPAPDGAPKLVVWDTVGEREVFRHVFDPAVAPPGASFLNDLVVDEPFGFAYVTQSGMGGPPGLVVFEIHRDHARRALDGHHAAAPQPDRDMTIEGEVVLLHRPDGAAPWRVAANSIALVDGTLLFGAMSSDTLYAVPTLALRDERLTDDERAAQVSDWGPKPVSDGICTAGERVFATDVENSAIVELDGTGAELVVSAPELSFPVACEVADGWIWFTTNQLHRAPLLGGDDRRSPPYGLWRVPLPRAGAP